MDNIVMSFKEALLENGGCGMIYDKDIRDILLDWKSSDWAHVDDYIAPIAAQVIINASEIDRELYDEIMSVIARGYEKLRKQDDLRDEELEVRQRRAAFHAVKKENSPS